MKKEEIISVLSSVNFWGREDIDVGIERKFYNSQILNFLKGVEKVITITGVRRSGKSYILKQIGKKLSEKFGKENVLYVNFEEVKFFEELSLSFLIKIYDAFKEIVRPKTKPFLILDEIQEVPKWEKFVRSLHEKKEAFLIISGSSSKLFSEELATLLAGRELEIEVFPLDFKEFLQFKNFEIEKEIDLIIKKEKIIRFLREFLEFGGFPEVVLEENENKKIGIIRKYFDTIVLKDVLRRFKLRESYKLEALCNYYVSNFSNLITFNSVARFLKISEKTTERFSKYLQIARIIFFVERFSYSFKSRYKSARKVYVIDTSFSNLLGIRFSENIGRLMENLVAIELLRRSKRSLKENFFYLKINDSEVDFVIKEGLNIKQLIQVTYASNKDEIEKREIKALLKASELLKCKDLLIITWDYEDEINFENKTIKCIPLWKWLLS
ncbi:MAG: ATP-binding protein [Candidatus Aenigmatarchaeota archaeon]